jgi:hypothetical protein
MKITIRVSNGDLRGVAFKRYPSVLGNLIGETYSYSLDIDDIDISKGLRTIVAFDGRASKSEEAADILDMARTITDRKVRDGYFN